MQIKTAEKKLRKKRLIVRIFAFTFLVMQLMGYAGQTGTVSEQNNDLSEAIGYYLGYNIFFIIAAVLFYWSWKIKQEIKKNREVSIIETIGQTDNNS